jgi:hypothetical protein
MKEKIIQSDFNGNTVEVDEADSRFPQHETRDGKIGIGSTFIGNKDFSLEIIVLECKTLEVF